MMYREYLRIGYLNGMTESGVAVDTKAALEAGGRISDELRDARFVFPRSSVTVGVGTNLEQTAL